MKEREVISVDPIEDTDWGDDTKCMRDTGAAYCDGDATKLVELKYDDEPDKTFYSALCDSCVSTYTKEWDRAMIFGE